MSTSFSRPTDKPGPHLPGGFGLAATMQSGAIAMKSTPAKWPPSPALPFFPDDLNYAGESLRSKVLGSGTSKRHRDIGKFDVAAAGNFDHHG